MKRIMMWLWLTAKRWCKKPSFLVMLLLLPLSAVALAGVAREESGMVRVALVAEDADALTAAVMDQLIAEHSLMYYTVCATPEEAVTLVQNGTLDAAWIFAEDLSEKVEAFAAEGREADPLVRVVERESNLLLQLSRERLSGVLYPYCSRALYVQYIQTGRSELAALSADELITYYDEHPLSLDLFQFQSPDAQESDDNVGYLTAPLRGVLAVLLLLCALAVAVFYGQDEERGMFAWLPLSRRPWAELGYQVTAVLPMAAVMLVTLSAAGFTGVLWREALLLFCYALCCVCFAMLVRQAVRHLTLLAVLIPVFTVVLLAVCPVFVELREVRVLQLAFPPTYYLYGASNNRYWWYMAAYTAVLCGITALLYKISLAKKPKL